MNHRGSRYNATDDRVCMEAVKSQMLQKDRSKENKVLKKKLYS